MARTKIPHPTVLITAVISRYDEAIAWATERAECEWGPIELISEPFDFDNTYYYRDTMGSPLKKVFLAHKKLIDSSRLADIKLQTCDWEDEYNAAANTPEPRALNLDPGYMTEAKLVLATTKDRDHRIYLSQGIHAEITLFYHQHQWKPHRWTYHDFRREDFHAFFSKCRDYLRTQLPHSANKKRRT